MKILCEDCQTEHEELVPCPICEPLARALRNAWRNRRVWSERKLKHPAQADYRSPHNDD